MIKISPQREPQEARRASMERVYHTWDDAIARGDVEALVNLYAPNATIESPLVHEFTGGKTGVLRGRESFHAFYEEVARLRSNVIRPRHPDNYLTDGHRIVWEYARAWAQGEQSEFVESWDFDENFEILCHRVYWGWSRIADLTRKGFGASDARHRGG